MERILPSRDQALAILHQHTSNQNLVKHGLAVEAVMRAIAIRHHQDPEFFGLVGLLHDFDYEEYPDIGQHTIEGGRILANAGFPDAIIQAIQSHVTENGLSRDQVVEKAIFAADELTGFVVAVTLVRPSQSLSEVTARSVIKKLKDKGFARGVNRQDVYEGVSGLGEDLDSFITFIVETLKPHAEALGLHP